MKFTPITTSKIALFYKKILIEFGRIFRNKKESINNKKVSDVMAAEKDSTPTNRREQTKPDASKTNSGEAKAEKVVTEAVTARELVNAINQLSRTVVSLNRAIVQLHNNLKPRSTSKSSYVEKTEINQSKTIH